MLSRTHSSMNSSWLSHCKSSGQRQKLAHGQAPGSLHSLFVSSISSIYWSSLPSWNTNFIWLVGHDFLLVFLWMHWPFLIVHWTSSSHEIWMWGVPQGRALWPFFSSDYIHFLSFQCDSGPATPVLTSLTRLCPEFQDPKSICWTSLITHGQCFSSWPPESISDGSLALPLSRCMSRKVLTY